MSAPNSEPLAPIFSQALAAKPHPHSRAKMDPSCKKWFRFSGTDLVPKIGTKSGAKVPQNGSVFREPIWFPKNGTKNGSKDGKRMYFVYVFIHFGQFCRPLPVGSHEPLFWFLKNGTILWSGGIDFGSKKRNRFGTQKTEPELQQGDEDFRPKGSWI